ncbi:putative transcriptional regulator AraC family [Candidatus Sulfotelmatobacter sp. SbA7]|jgi:AraC-like DNA-binding protein|nr:putative transcriptional regulator AraC family [Candidatus Sulfotelmatobacter sp. SbA7]
MAPYLELVPPPPLADSVECFWTMESQESFRHRVLPDGCADIIFTRDSGKASLTVVGTMTRFADFEISSRQQTVGVRFRPGMWREHFGVPSPEITDSLLPLEDVWGARGRALLEQMVRADSPQQCAAMLGRALKPSRARTPVQRALAWMEANPGCVSLDDVAFQTGLSPRQFRRICLQQTGISPKLLARVLRFRKALARVQSQAGEHAGLAADCGYFDQSHFIAEFQRFAGQTPAAYLRAAR